MKLTKYGIKEWLSGSITALILLLGATMLYLNYNKIIGAVVAFIVVVAWLCLVAFFRSPERNISFNANLILAPADGVVTDIEIINSEKLDFSNGYDMLRIGIFLSVFDVHINRAPTDMIVKNKKYQPGKKHDARNQLAISENESMLLSGEFDVKENKLPIGVRQISGAIARRIVCPVFSGKRLKQGEDYGMIKFGSRTELFLPVCSEISLKVPKGQRVYAGISILAEIITSRSINSENKKYAAN